MAGALVAGLVCAASAAASCNPGRPPYSGTYQDGWRTGPFISQPCLNGSLGLILNATPFVYPGAAETSAWTMLYNNNANGYGQVGWDIDSNGNRHNFVQTNTVDVFFNKDFASSPSGSSPEYKTTYSANAFHYFVDGTNYYNVSSPSYTGCSAEQAGEIKNKDSQMPGTTSTHDYVTGAQVRRASDNTWFNPGSFGWDVYNDNSSWFGQSFTYTPATIQFWDKNC